MKQSITYLFSGLLLSLFLLQSSCSNKLDRDEVRMKVGQLFLLAFSGEEADAVLPFIKERGIGGLYLSNENLREPAQAAKLLNELQVAAINGISKQPLLTACDQEGAWGIMVPYSTTGPGNMALGASPVANTMEMYSIFSQELSAIGAFCNLSPASDVNSNALNPIIGTRSFGENAQDVADRVKAAIKGLHKNGIIATAKHFPGHGNTSTDSHSGIPKVTRSLQEIEAIDLLPFKAAIEADVDLIMTAHIIYDALDPKNPATLSSKILKGYLREKLGFKGVIITDSFNMGAIQESYDPSEAAIATILAGADMIMLAEERYGKDVGDYIKSQTKMLNDVEQAVMDGIIPMERINEAYNRIISLKKKYNLAEKITINTELAASIVGSKKNKEAAIRIAEAALYIAYDSKSLIPLKSGSSVSIVKLAKENVEEIIKIAAGIGPNYYDAYADFVIEMKTAGFNVTEYNYDADIPNENIIICVSENYPLPGKSLDLEEQHKRLIITQKTNKASIINIALKDPYDANLVSPDAYVSTMGSNISNVKAAVNLLLGKAEAKGRLPVTPIKK
ncbi:MAG: glycoside hydrolase family 3 N-terminal domain-containing protein [Cellulophaga sp.]